MIECKFGIFADQNFEMGKKRTIAAGTSMELVLPANISSYAAIMQDAPVMTAIFDAATRQPLYFNRAFEAATGYTNSEFRAGAPDFWRNAVNRQDLSLFDEHFRNVQTAAEAEVQRLKFRFSHANGRELSLQSTSRVFARGDDGELLQIVSFFEDLTNAAHAEVDRFRLGTIVEGSEDAIISKEFDGTILSWNKGAEKIFGFTAEEAAGQNITIIYPLERLAEEFEIIEKIRAGGEIKNFETVRTNKKGEYIPVSLNISPIRNARSEIIAVSSIVKDISERKEVEEKFYENDRRLFLITNSIPGLVSYIDKDLRLRFVNRELTNWFGISQQDALGKKLVEVIGDRAFQTLRPKIEAVLRGEEQNFEELVNYDNVHSRFIRASYVPDFDAHGNVKGYYSLIVDVSEHKIAEEALRQSEERYRVFIEQSSEGIWRFEIAEPISINLDIETQIELIFSEGYLAECNNAMAQQHGFANSIELIGKRIGEFISPENLINREYFRNFIKSDYHLSDVETVETAKDGSDVYFSNNLVGIVEDGKLVRAWGTQRDITATKQAQQAFQESEEQLRQSTKIEAIGRLAGGIAHDFNNFLAVIMLHVDMLNLQLPPESPLRFRINEIKSVTNNAAEMVRQLLAFGRKTTLQPHPVILNHVVREFVKILRPIVGEDVEIQLDLESELGVCFVDHNQIIQVLMNLAVNARDAMPSGGVLRVETRNKKIDRHTPRHKAQPRGSYIELSVADNGIGMESQVQEKIFEPFFTTKESGKGTGLGLATVYGIVKQSNGFIWVESETGKGTTFRVQFPRIDSTPTIVKKEAPEVILRGNETILLVEDEEKIRRAAVEVLVVLGYQVLEAKHGVEALEIAENYGKPIHLLLTDVVMPRMNGRDLAEKIKEFHPESAILFMSGYDDEIIARHGILEDNVQFISKPFSPGTLALKVRESLETT